MSRTRRTAILVVSSLLAATVWGQTVGENTAPDCSGASPSLETLWPPNHDLVEIRIEGVTDVDGDDPEVIVVGVTQDEPLVGTGDGDTCPDVSGVEIDETVSLRAERSGNGDGRVYHVSFTADDGAGGTCAGEVVVCVPHDQGDGACADGGPLVDSTGGTILCDGEACYADDCRPPATPTACAGVSLPASLVRRLERAGALLERAAYDAETAAQEVRWRLRASKIYRKVSGASVRSGARGRIANACGDALGAQLAGAATCAACLLPPE